MFILKILILKQEIIHIDHSVEVFEIDFCNQSICWFNDWWEGQPYITMIGITDVKEAFNQGNYNVLIKEYKDEDYK